VGLRGLAGGQSLAGLLQEHAALLEVMRREDAAARGRMISGVTGRRQRPISRLSVPDILAWADAHHAATGSWPSRTSGPIAGVAGEDWARIDSALCSGTRGLRRGKSLKRLLIEERGAEVASRTRKLSVEQILRWADHHHEVHGVWPNGGSGPVDGAPAITWAKIDIILRRGGGGLKGGLSLTGLLTEARWGSAPRLGSALDVEQIKAWAGAHHARYGKWPTAKSGLVTAAPGEFWSVIDVALRKGYRGLKGGSSLHLLLELGRSTPRRRLTLELIVSWADAHHAATGRWPGAGSGVIAAAPDETWSRINSALWMGCRGLPAGMSLKKLLAGREVPAHAANGSQTHEDYM
jgi:hypothetical protein